MGKMQRIYSEDRNHSHSQQIYFCCRGDICGFGVDRKASGGSIKLCFQKFS